MIISHLILRNIFKIDNSVYRTAILVTSIIFLHLFFIYILPHFRKKSDSNKFFVFILELLFPGTGFSYMRFYKIGVMISLLFVSFTLALSSKIISTTVAFIILLLFIVTPFIAVNSINISNKLLSKKIAKEKIKKKYNTLMSFTNKDLIFALDTNILMHESEILRPIIENTNTKFVIAKTVFSELEGLKKNSNYTVRQNAQLGFDMIEMMQKKNCLDLTSHIRLNDNMHKTADESIIHTYDLLHKSKYPNLVFISNDKGARIIARELKLPVLDWS